MNYGLVSNSAFITEINTYDIIKASATAKKPGVEELCIIPGYPAGRYGEVLAVGIAPAGSIKDEFAGVRPHIGITCFTPPVN